MAPLSHLALGLMGEGKMWSPKSGWADAKYVSLLPLDAVDRESIMKTACKHIYSSFIRWSRLTFELPAGLGGARSEAHISEAKGGTVNPPIVQSTCLSLLT